MGSIPSGKDHKGLDLLHSGSEVKTICGIFSINLTSRCGIDSAEYRASSVLEVNQLRMEIRAKGGVRSTLNIICAIGPCCVARSTSSPRRSAMPKISSRV